MSLCAQVSVGSSCQIHLFILTQQTDGKNKLKGHKQNFSRSGAPKHADVDICKAMLRPVGDLFLGLTVGLRGDGEDEAVCDVSVSDC